MLGLGFRVLSFKVLCLGLCFEMLGLGFRVLVQVAAHILQLAAPYKALSGPGVIWVWTSMPLSQQP